MNNQKSLIYPLLFAAAAVVFFITIFIGFRAYIGLKGQALTNHAVDSCGALARSIVKDQFVRPIYKACLEDKGYSTNLED